MQVSSPPFELRISLSIYAFRDSSKVAKLVRTTITLEIMRHGVEDIYRLIRSVY